MFQKGVLIICFTIIVATSIFVLVAFQSSKESIDLALIFSSFLFFYGLILGYHFISNLPFLLVMSSLIKSKQAFEIELLGVGGLTKSAVSWLNIIFKLFIAFFISIFIIIIIHMLTGEYPVPIITLGAILLTLFYIHWRQYRIIRLLWFRQSRKLLIEIEELALIIELYQRKIILQDPDWVRGYEDFYRLLRARQGYSEK